LPPGIRISKIKNKILNISDSSFVFLIFDF